jgi:hypothetical protein
MVMCPTLSFRFEAPPMKASVALLVPMVGVMLLATGPARAADPAHPVVVELFQSQGCSSCPPANANVMAIAGRADVLALSFGVTYWDSLGWKDTFASPKFTARQWDYAHGLGHSNVFTPQVVVNGRRDGVGVDRDELQSLVAAGDRGNGGPALTVRGAVLSISATRRDNADVWLVRYDPRIVQVPIRRGENSGRTLPHRNIVRELTRIGRWSGAAETLALPAPTDTGLRTAILLQKPDGGPILAALRL